MGPFEPLNSTRLDCRCRDGRLKENDQILAINDQVLSSGVSHQTAVVVLQTATGLVRLLVAHSLTSASHHEHGDTVVVTQQSSPADQPTDMVVSPPYLLSVTVVL